MNKEKIKRNQAKFKTKKSETHQQMALWIEKELLQSVKEAALSQGWIATEGRNAGDVHINLAIEELLKLGLTKLKSDTSNDS